MGARRVLAEYPKRNPLSMVTFPKRHISPATAETAYVDGAKQAVSR